jgi:hypothetical protein
LAGFSATSKPNHVRVSWETVSEVGITGFDLQRGPSAAGPWQKLNPQPIPTATPGGTGGHAYSWIDSTAPQGALYYYRLDEILTDGSTQQLAITSVSHTAAFGLWLPLMIH